MRSHLSKFSLVTIVLFMSVLGSTINNDSVWYSSAGRANIAGEHCSYVGTSFGFDRVECQTAPKNVPVNPLSHLNRSIKFNAAESKAANPSQILLLSGSKSAVADKGEYMVMAIVENETGMTVPDGTSVDLYSDGALFSRAVTKGGVAWALQRAHRQVCNVEIMARVNDVTARSNSIRVVPAEPVSLRTHSNDEMLPLSNEQEVWIRTDEMRDHLGNRLNDGALVQFTGKDEFGRGLVVNSLAVNGVATAKLINRNLTKSISLLAHHKDVVGSNETVKLQDIDVEKELAVGFEAISGRLKITIGPIKRIDGGFVPDGTLFEVHSDDGHFYDAISFDGQVVFQISNLLRNKPSSGKTQYQIEALGKRWIASFDNRKGGYSRTTAKAVESKSVQ